MLMSKLASRCIRPLTILLIELKQISSGFVLKSFIIWGLRENTGLCSFFYFKLHVTIFLL